MLAGPDARLTVLDGTDPVQLAEALAGDLESTVLVVSAPPGAPTAGVELVWDAVAGALRADRLDADAATVVVAAPGSALIARAGDATVVLGPEDVHGPWASLTAYALVPAGLAGADIGELVADAAQARELLAADDPSNPALVLGASLADTAVAVLDGREPLAEWVAALLVDGLGSGLLPVVVESPAATGWDAADARTVGFDDGFGDDSRADIVTEGGAAAQMLLWQHAVATAAHLAGPVAAADPVAAAGVPDGTPAFVDAMVAVHAPWLPPGTTTVTGALRALLAGGGRQLAVHAYLDRLDDASAALLRPELARRTGLVTAFGWAERALPAAAAVCQITGSDADDDPADAGVHDPFGTFQQDRARAAGAELARGGARVLRLHLRDRVAGLVTLVRAVQQL